MCAPLVLLAIASAPKTWYGPQVVSFNIQYAGNPYDSAVNDVKVKFANDSGFSMERPAYFDHGVWKALLVSPFPGRYKSTLYHNGKASQEEAVPNVADLTQPLPHGFVVRDVVDRNRFEYDDSSLIFPIGLNLGWQKAGAPTLDTLMKETGGNGLTWTRIWSAAWDSRNPWWPVDDPYAVKDQLWTRALDRWSALAGDCDNTGIDYQFVLFDGQSLDPNANPGWIQNPWNSANGGFLKIPSQFFTDPEAKRREKMWLHYAAARWGGDPFLFGWELMANIGSEDSAEESNIQSWTKEMSAYLRSVDAYAHLLTLTENRDDPILWSFVDYSQNESVEGMPGFSTRIDSNSDLGPSDERRFLRSEIWDSIRKNNGAAAMYAHWDRVEADGLFPELHIWSQILSDSKLAEHSQALAVDANPSSGEAQALRDTNWILIRLQGAKGKMPKLSWPGMIEGTWEAIEYDLDAGQTEKEIDSVKGASIQLGRIRGNDMVLLVRKVKDF